MIHNLIHLLLKRRHFWRYANFDEVAELYASRTMRILAQQMIGLFIALYLYQQGYTLIFIAGFFLVSFSFRTLIAYPVAKFVAKHGPKHGILLGNLLYIPALVAFTLVPQYGIYAIIVFGVFQATSMVINDLAYMVDFSKVKHVEHAGKEIGFMQILERFTASVSPFIGGLIAFVFAPEATMWLSAIIFMFAAVPLFRTREPISQNQKMSFKGFPWRTVRRSVVAETAIGFDDFSSLGAWVLFLAVVIIVGTSNDMYLTIGFFTSVTVVMAFLSAYAFGRIIDWRHGGDLLRIGTLLNSATHLFRAFVTTPAGVIAANVSNEIATTGYSMAFMRGLFDTADYSRHRVAYMYLIVVARNIGSVFASLALLLLLIVAPNVTLAFQLFFAVAAVYVLIAMTARFRLYQ